GTLSLALLHGGQRQRALELAARGMALMRGTRPVNGLMLGGVYTLAEVYLAAWELARGGPAAEARELERAAGEACRLLGAFARAFTFAEPSFLLCDGLRAWNSGRTGAALRAWQRCAGRAGELEMPYEEARARLELGRRLAPGDPAREAHLARARELFQRLEAAADLARAEAGAGEAAAELPR
ncbi:MAG TPA: serine/threonine-protein kinase PknK, partial [Myxococcus sp.]|nr:serine/threonine-protein kinase PknK [Myxococcus sp.]